MFAKPHARGEEENEGHEQEARAVRWSCPFIAFAALVVSFVSCSGEGSKNHDADGKPQESIGQDVHALVPGGYPYDVLTSNHPTPPCEVNPQRTSFEDHFGYVNAVGDFVRLHKTESVIDWNSLRTKLDLLSPQPPAIRAIVFHYGLNMSKEFVLGLEPVIMKYMGGATYEIDETVAKRFYTIDTAGLLVGANLTDWQQHEQAEYFLTVMVKRKNGEQPDKLDQKCDVKSYLLPWDGELAYLWSHNQDTTATKKFVVFSHSEVDPPADAACRESYRHHVAVLLRAGNKELLRDFKNVDFVYWRKAADLGSPCPPRCKSFEFKAPSNTPPC